MLPKCQRHACAKTRLTETGQPFLRDHMEIAEAGSPFLRVLKNDYNKNKNTTSCISARQSVLFLVAANGVLSWMWFMLKYSHKI